MDNVSNVKIKPSIKIESGVTNAPEIFNELFDNTGIEFKSFNKREPYKKGINLNGREVAIDSVTVRCLERNINEASIVIDWSGNIGFGRYVLYTENDVYHDDKIHWKADSECMGRGEDKEFIRLLLDKFVEELEVVG